MLISEIRARAKEKDTDMTVSVIIIAAEEFWRQDEKSAAHAAVLKLFILAQVEVNIFIAAFQINDVNIINYRVQFVNCKSI